MTLLANFSEKYFLITITQRGDDFKRLLKRMKSRKFVKGERFLINETVKQRVMKK